MCDMLHTAKFRKLGYPLGKDFAFREAGVTGYVRVTFLHMECEVSRCLIRYPGLAGKSRGRWGTLTLNLGPVHQAHKANTSSHFPSINWYSFLHGCFSPIPVVETGCSWVICRPQLGSSCWSLHPTLNLWAWLFQEQLTLTDSTTTGRDGERKQTLHSVSKLHFLWVLQTSVSPLDPVAWSKWLSTGIKSKKGIVALDPQNTSSRDRNIYGGSSKAERETHKPKLSTNMERIHCESQGSPKRSSPALSTWSRMWATYIVLNFLVATSLKFKKTGEWILIMY